MSDKQKSISLADELRTAEIHVGKNTHTITELTGLQRFTLDEESCLDEFGPDDSSVEAAKAFFGFKTVALALSLEQSIGKPWREIHEAVKFWRSATVNDCYEVLAEMIFQQADDQESEERPKPDAG